MTFTTNAATLLFVLLCVTTLLDTTVCAWSTPTIGTGSTTAAASTRRGFLQTASGIVLTVALPTSATAAAAATGPYLEELKLSKSKLEAIPDLLQDKEWDAVRTILKTPPVNKLWNLGDSQNTILNLAKDTGNVELFEVKDDLAYDLQICDQLTYGNAFIYFQPGSGKVNINEPTKLARNAMAKIDEAIAMANE